VKDRFESMSRTFLYGLMRNGVLNFEKTQKNIEDAPEHTHCVSWNWRPGSFQRNCGFESDLLQSVGAVKLRSKFSVLFVCVRQFISEICIVSQKIAN